MSIRQRIEDAKILWENDRFEGAIIHILIALAGTIRKRYPKKEYSDTKAFRLFIKDEVLKITNGPEGFPIYYDGKANIPVEDILYKFIRCELIHEGSLPTNIELTKPEFEKCDPFGKNPDGKPYDTGIFNHLKLYEILGFPIGWIWNMLKVIVDAPENIDEFIDYDCPIPENYSFYAGLKLSYPDENPERFPPNRASS